LAGEIIGGVVVFLSVFIYLKLENKYNNKYEKKLAMHINKYPWRRRKIGRWQKGELNEVALEKDIALIHRQYKHGHTLTTEIDGKEIQYGVFGHAKYLLSWAMLYYRGGIYVLDHTADGNYHFTEDMMIPDNVRKIFTPLLPEISRTVNMFNLYEHPKHEFWNLDTLSCLDAEYALHSVASTLLDLVFFQWYFYTERDTLDPTFPLYYLTNVVEHPERDLVEIYPEDALYQFTVGWMMAVSPDFFQSNPDHFVGRDMMMKAHRLEPANPLYKWAISKQLNLTREETRALAAQVQPSQFGELEPFVGDYFMDILRSDAQVRF
jgi:hypothetical protein